MAPIPDAPDTPPDTPPVTYVTPYGPITISASSSISPAINSASKSLSELSLKWTPEGVANVPPQDLLDYIRFYQRKINQSAFERTVLERENVAALKYAAEKIVATGAMRMSNPGQALHDRAVKRYEEVQTKGPQRLARHDKKHEELVALRKMFQECAERRGMKIVRGSRV